MAEATGSGNFETANKLLSTGSISMLALSLAGLAPIAIYSQKLARMSGVPPEFLGAAAGAITLLALIMVMANFGSAFEAIVMGAHRIDLARTFNMVTTAGEAVAIITLLHYGRGLFAMAITMAASELVYVCCCFAVSRRIVPEIQIRMSYFTTGVLRELVRFPGSYQLVNVLEVLYSMLLPVTILKFFGAEIAGVYAVQTRLVTAFLIGPGAMILPLLSGGTFVFATGSAERLARFFRKSFKVTVAVTLLPLSLRWSLRCIASLCMDGSSQPSIWRGDLANLSVRLFQFDFAAAAGAVPRVRERAARQYPAGVSPWRTGGSGGLRQVDGFHGVLLGLVLAELIGVIYMFSAMTSVLSFFDPRKLIPDAMRLTAATAVMITVGVAAE